MRPMLSCTQAMVIGILANGEAMSMALVVGVFLANFPEDLPCFFLAPSAYMI